MKWIILLSFFSTMTGCAARADGQSRVGMFFQGVSDGLEEARKEREAKNEERERIRQVVREESFQQSSFITPERRSYDCKITRNNFIGSESVSCD